jgi:hypothetical protein
MEMGQRRRTASLPAQSTSSAKFARNFARTGTATHLPAIVLKFKGPKRSTDVHPGPGYGFSGA